MWLIVGLEFGGQWGPVGSNSGGAICGRGPGWGGFGCCKYVDGHGLGVVFIRHSQLLGWRCEG